MIKRFSILISALVCTTMLAAQGYTPRTVPNVQLQDARRFVSNPDGILSAQAVDEIDRMCLDLTNNGLAEVAVIVLDEVDVNSLDLFAHNVLNTWGVGKKGADNGLVISVVRRQRDIQFATGYGLEGVLPDALCKRIQTAYMVGPLGQGDFDKGVTDGVRAVYNVLTGNAEELSALAGNADGSSGYTLGKVIAIFVIAFVILIVLLGISRRRGGGNNGSNGTGSFGGGLGSFLGGFLLGGGLGGMGGGSFGGGGFGGGFGGGRSGGGGSRSGF